jgi:hypothetical protein
MPKTDPVTCGRCGATGEPTPPADLPDGWGVIHVQARPMRAHTVCSGCLAGFRTWWDAFRTPMPPLIQQSGNLTISGGIKINQ